MNRAAALRRAKPRDRSGWLKKGAYAGLGLAAVLLVGLAGGAVVHAYWLHRDLQASYARSRVETAQMQIQILESALELYRAEHGAYPSDDEGLAALEPYFGDRPPLDPWGYTYVYRRESAPRVVSYGADGKAGGEGDAADIAAPERP